MIRALQVSYKEDSIFKGRNEKETKQYNNYQSEGFKLYKKCNFSKELKRNINKHIEEYTKFFIHDNTLMTVSPVRKGYSSGYYEHCRGYGIFVDHDNKCLLLVK